MLSVPFDRFLLRPPSPFLSSTSLSLSESEYSPSSLYTVGRLPLVEVTFPSPTLQGIAPLPAFPPYILDLGEVVVEREDNLGEVGLAGDRAREARVAI